MIFDVKNTIIINICHIQIVEDIPPTSAIQKRLEFLETLTCLNVHTSGDLPVYHCTLDDGQLMGKWLDSNFMY